MHKDLERTGICVNRTEEDLITWDLCDPGTSNQTLLLQHRRAVFAKLINSAGVSLS